MTLFKVTVFASTDDWRVSIKKYDAKETSKSFLISDYTNHRLSKDKICVTDTISIDSDSCISRCMYILNEDDICKTIEILVSVIKDKANDIQRNIESLILNSPKGKIDNSKIVIENIETTQKFTLTDDML